MARRLNFRSGTRRARRGNRVLRSLVCGLCHISLPLPRFRSITQSYYRSAHALILVYDVTNQPTFDCCPDWLREIEEYASPKVLRVLVGNKIDRDDHEIPGDVGEEFANRHGMYFLQTSAKNCDNVDRLFTEIAHELLQQVTHSKTISLFPQLLRLRNLYRKNTQPFKR